MTGNQAGGDSLGVYVHIPFCRSKCAYCDFYSLAGREGRMEDYHRALLAHIRRTAQKTGPLPVDTVYFGGGTPSFYGVPRLAELLAALKAGFRVEEEAEITLEANPDSVDTAALARARRAGFNRLSMGFQSADPGQLAAVCRPHTVEQGDRAVAAAREAGFDNLSLDLIYGLPGQSAESWARTVDHALSLAPEHLSCYGLTLEEGTPLAAQAAAGQVSLPDGDQQADCYLWAVERLGAAGYAQYEISNFARPGRASRHNLRYWLTRPYLAFGPGAHGDFGGFRYAWVRDLEGYIAALAAGEEPLEFRQPISPRERVEEYLMLRLRTAEGVERGEYEALSGEAFAPLEDRLALFSAQGWAERTPAGRWRLIPRGFLVSNPLIGDLLDRIAE